mgnify:CR=1 FL=1
MMKALTNITSKTKFRTAEKIYSSQWKDIEAAGVELYENYYIEEDLDNGSTMRFFKNREKVNKVCLMKGEMPSGQARSPLTVCMRITTVLR